MRDYDYIDLKKSRKGKYELRLSHDQYEYVPIYLEYFDDLINNIDQHCQIKFHDTRPVISRAIHSGEIWGNLHWHEQYEDTVVLRLYFIDLYHRISDPITLDKMKYISRSIDFFYHQNQISKTYEKVKQLL